MPREVLLKKVPFPLPNPDIFNLDQVLAFANDTVVSENALTFMDLGVLPHKLKGYPVEFLIQHRKGGPQFGSLVSEKVNPDSYPQFTMGFLFIPKTPLIWKSLLKDKNERKSA
ncbi:NADH dehydrogenase [ubiquinone] 1 alpha subcomplex subunit 9, mitochondrial-like [Hibiscus syriacus]|uniref:NADH dehydrogenase [ubiquinone] 1 alpha subcomplex subunit 9, mitochondrial-like n=1 Tax=Hibiscus syriacus TaxID=106335 RepID=UPI001922AB4C|nr:NADH dehydrogenase [ubiquinone] 1 alpha subcomplex subunit 9, mitochondrial-like [Hibiscus syriacus]